MTTHPILILGVISELKIRGFKKRSVLCHHYSFLLSLKIASFLKEQYRTLLCFFSQHLNTYPAMVFSEIFNHSKNVSPFFLSSSNVLRPSFILFCHHCLRKKCPSSLPRPTYSALAASSQAACTSGFLWNIAPSNNWFLI